MKIAGVAKDLALILDKPKGYNFVTPVIEDEGKFYIQRHQNEIIYNIVDIFMNMDDENEMQEWLDAFLPSIDDVPNKIGSIYNRKYKLVDYEPEFGDMDNLDHVDERFHIEPDLEINPEKLILGISYNEDIFIGSAGFIVTQMELLVGSDLTLEEVDLLYRLYGMAEQFDKMAEMIDKALELTMGTIVYFDWIYRKNHFEVEMKTEKLINAYNQKRYALTTEEK